MPLHGGLSDFRIRRDDGRKLEAAAAAGAEAGVGAARAQEEDGEGEKKGGRRGAAVGVGVDGVYFPLLATIIPKWRAVVHGLPAAGAGGQQPQPQQQHPQVFKIVFLVSGVGMPRDPSSSATGNSTEGACVRRRHASHCIALAVMTPFVFGWHRLTD